MFNLGFKNWEGKTILSSYLDDLTIFSDEEYVDFHLCLGNYTLFKSRYYTFDNKAFVYDIRSIVEMYICNNPQHNCDIFSIEVSTKSGLEDLVEFYVLFCHLDLPLGNSDLWLKDNFLTLNPVQRVAPDGIISISWYSTEEEDISFGVYASFIDDSGNSESYFYSMSGYGLTANSNGIITEIVHLNDVVSSLKECLQIESLTLQSVTLRCGNRSATFFVDPTLTGIVPFYYLNNFGQVEQFAVASVTTEKVKSDRSIASLGKASQFYDITTSKEYQVETGGLTSDECAQAEQMLTSPSVRVPFGHDAVAYETDFFALTEILITDFTSEISDGDEKLNSVKFTWRFAVNRPKTAAPYTPGIFDDKFQPPFS